MTAGDIAGILSRTRALSSRAMRAAWNGSARLAARNLLEGSRSVGALLSFALQDQQAFALLLAEPKQLHSFGFRRLCVGRLDATEIVGARTHDGDTPVAELGGGGLSLR